MAELGLCCWLLVTEGYGTSSWS